VLQREIEAQQDFGWADTLEEDQYLVDVNLEDLENTLGKRQEYWLIVMLAAREASSLQGQSQMNVCSRQGIARRRHLYTQL
jgi:hypothetical protein